MKSNFNGDQTGEAISLPHKSCWPCILPRIAVVGCALHLLLLTTLGTTFTAAPQALRPAGG
jgi:hypothetical protein